MAKLSVVAGTTSKLVKIFANNSSVTTGAGLTGLAYNTSSLTAYYIREGANAAVAISLATATLGTWASGGFIVVDGTNMPGIYELGIPDAALAAGAKSVLIMLKGAANMAPCLLEIELTAWNNQDAMRGGLTALPNANAGASGGLPTVDSSNAVKLQSGTSANQISLSSGAVLLQATQSGVTIPTVTTLTTAPDVSASVQTGLTAQGYTTTRAGYLDTLNGLVAAILAATVEGAITLGGALRIGLAWFGGKASGGNTVSPTFRDIGDTKNRIAMTVDADGNRSAVTLDGTL